MMKSRSSATVFVAGDGRELFRARLWRPRLGELVATCDGVFFVWGKRRGRWLASPIKLR
jgi:hypothetical protein